MSVVELKFREYFAVPANWEPPVIKQSRGFSLRALVEYMNGIAGDQNSILDELKKGGAANLDICFRLLKNLGNRTAGLAPIKEAAQQYVAKSDAEAEWIECVEEMISLIDQLALRCPKLEGLTEEMESIHRQLTVAV